MHSLFASLRLCVRYCIFTRPHDWVGRCFFLSPKLGKTTFSFNVLEICSQCVSLAWCQLRVAFKCLSNVCKCFNRIDYDAWICGVKYLSAPLVLLCDKSIKKGINDRMNIRTRIPPNCDGLDLFSIFCFIPPNCDVFMQDNSLTNTWIEIKSHFHHDCIQI